jgi:hypothetical protein
LSKPRWKSKDFDRQKNPQMPTRLDIPLRSRDSLTAQKWVCAVLGIILLAVVLYYSFSSERVRNVAGLWGIFGPTLLGVCVAFRQAQVLERVLKDPFNAEQIARYKKVLNKSFEDARLFMEAHAQVLSENRVAMASPLTWGRKQGMATFWDEPFEVTILENNGRVGSLRIVYKSDN